MKRENIYEFIEKYKEDDYKEPEVEKTYKSLYIKDIIDNQSGVILITELVEVFIEHANLLKSEKLLDIEKEMFNNILNFKANDVQIQNSLKLLSRLLYSKFSIIKTKEN